MPDRRHPVDVGLRTRPEREIRVARFKFIGSDDRRLTKPECISPEIDRQRPRHGVGGEQPSCGPELVEVLGDRERVPDHDVAVREARYEERRRKQHQFGATRRIVTRKDVHLQVETREFHTAAIRGATTRHNFCC